MGIINFILGLLMTTFFVTIISMICTFPSWIAGRWHWDPARRPKATLFTETPARRWSLWGISSLLALIGLTVLINMNPGSLSPLGGVMFTVGAVFAQYFAFLIGFTAVDRKHAHRNPHLYAALPEGMGPQHMARRAEEVHPLSLPMRDTEADRGPELGEPTLHVPHGTDLSTPDYPMAEPRED